MEVNIRPAESNDLPALDPLFIQGDEWHARHVPTVFRTPTEAPRSRAHLLELLADPDSTILVAECEGEILGLLQLLIRPAPELPMMVPRRVGIVDTLIVVRRAQRQGIGRRLMLAGEEWFASRDCHELQLTVWSFNEGARALYAELGYEPASLRLGKRLD